MQRLVYYKCEYCHCKTRDLKKLEKHEEKCKVYTTTSDVAKRRIFALIHSYEKLGYKVSVIYSTEDREIVTVYHPEYGKIK